MTPLARPSDAAKHNPQACPVPLLVDDSKAPFSPADFSRTLTPTLSIPDLFLTYE